MSNSDNTTLKTVAYRGPRRVYSYKGANLICFAGQRFTSREGSKILSDFPVTKVEALEEGDLKTVTVTQRRRGRKGITEVWDLLAA